MGLSVAPFFTGAADVDAVAGCGGGVLPLSLVRFTSSGGAGLPSAFFPLGDGALMARSVGSFSFLAAPLLLDLDFAFGVASAGGTVTVGSVAVGGTRVAPLLLDRPLVADASLAAPADAGVAVGGPGVSNPLLLDRAGFSEVVLFDPNLAISGASSLFGTDTARFFSDATLLSLALTGPVPGGGGGVGSALGSPVEMSLGVWGLPR